MAWTGPLPSVTEESAPFWEALKAGKFMIYRCKACGRWYWPWALCRDHANEPWGANIQMAEASGRGKVFVFNIHRWEFHPSVPPPYVYALIELEEGPLFPGNVIGCAPEEVYVGMPVQVALEKLTEEFTIPKFRPVA